MNQLQESQKCAALGEEVVDDENPVFRAEEFLGQADGIGGFVGITVDF